MDEQGSSGADEIDEQVFHSLLAAADGDRPPPSLVVFDYDRTLTLETFNSAINDYVSGWKAQIDPWRVLDGEAGEGWESYDGRLTAEGLTAEELREEFHEGRHAQQSMQDYLRASFNNGERKAAAIHHADFLEEEVHNRSKRLYHLRHLLETIRAGLDQQTPRGKMVIMTYNADGAIFVLNTMIHADMSPYFDAIHSPLNSVENVEGKWALVCKEAPGSSPASNSRRRQTVTELQVEGCNAGRIHVHTGGTIATDSFGGKAHGVERMYKECGGLRNAVLVDDDPDLIAAWTELGGAYRVDLSQAPGDYKLTVAYIKQAEQCFQRWLGRKPVLVGAPAGAVVAPISSPDRAPVDCQ